MVKSNTDEKDFVHLKQDRTQSDNNKYGVLLAEQTITAWNIFFVVYLGWPLTYLP